MHKQKNELLPELANLRSSDENEFYRLVVNHLFKKCEAYRNQYTVFFFNGDEGVFEISGQCSFETYDEFNRFHQNVGRRDYHFVALHHEKGLKFIMNGKFLSALEIFSRIRRVIVYFYDQDLRDIIEGKKQLPPRTSAFRDMIIGKAIDMHAKAKTTNNRKLAS